jgi:hypothetical protein
MLRPAVEGRVAPESGGRTYMVYGFDLARNAVEELQVLLNECVGCDVAQAGIFLKFQHE